MTQMDKPKEEPRFTMVEIAAYVLGGLLSGQDTHTLQDVLIALHNAAMDIYSYQDGLEACAEHQKDWVGKDWEGTNRALEALFETAK
jgi:hypothetical protein